MASAPSFSDGFDSDLVDESVSKSTTEKKKQNRVPQIVIGDLSDLVPPRRPGRAFNMASELTRSANTLLNLHTKHVDRDSASSLGSSPSLENVISDDYDYYEEGNLVPPSARHRKGSLQLDDGANRLKAPKDRSMLRRMSLGLLGSNSGSPSSSTNNLLEQF